jgi:hypothetical protein
MHSGQIFFEEARDPLRSKTSAAKTHPNPGRH